ncbi:MAG: hypothetical protein HRF49_06260 [bacterium]|jgi:hypothetical protein
MQKSGLDKSSAAVAEFEYAVAPLLRLTPTGWCRVAERCALTDESFFVLPTPEAVVREAAGEIHCAPLPNAVDLRDHLKRQALARFPKRHFFVSSNLIDEIDVETGYFSGNIPELAIALGRPRHEIEDALDAISGLSPIGCAGRSIHDVLRNQIPLLPDSIAGNAARLLLTDFWEAFSGGGRAMLSEISGLGEQVIEEGVEAIRRHLTPYPAQLFWGKNGDYLKRAYYYLTYKSGGPELSPPHLSDYCAAIIPGRASERSRLAIAALKSRRTAYSKLGDAFSSLDLDDPHSSIPLSRVASSIGLSQWDTWQLLDGELLVDGLGQRRYLRTALKVEDPLVERLLRTLDEEVSGETPLTDKEIASRIFRDGIAPDAAYVAAARKALGIPHRKSRLPKAALDLLGYRTHAE